MAKQKTVNYHFFKSSFLTVKKIDLFSIKKKVKNLVYELKFLSFMKIHSIIFVVHLEQAKEDDFGREFTSALPNSVIIEETPQWVIKRIVGKETRDGKPGYKIK